MTTGNIRILPIEENDFETLIEMFREFAAFEKLPEKMINTLAQVKEEKDYIQGFTIKNETGNILGYVTYFYAYYTWIVSGQQRGKLSS